VPTLPFASPYLTVAEVACLLRIHKRSVIRLYNGYMVKIKNPDGSVTRVRKRPALAVVRIGGSVRIPKYELQRYLDARTTVV
jgi:hypothetical protein